MSEKNDYTTLKNGIRAPGDRINRIENAVSIGMPDVNCCIEGSEFWIELKSPIEPKRQTTKLFGSNHKLSQDQMNWMLSQRNAQGQAWVLISTDKRWMLVPIEHTDVINGMSVQEIVSISSWTANKPVKRKTEWEKLRAILVNSKQNRSTTNSGA